MIIVLRPGVSEKELNEVVKRIESLGYKAHINDGVNRKVIGAIGDERGKVVLEQLTAMHSVERVVPILKPHKLTSREFHPDDTVIDVDGIKMGPGTLTVIAGPCSVESRQQILDCACHVRKAGACLLRGGAFKPRSSPYNFQGMGEEGLRLLKEAKEKEGLPIVTEAMSSDEADIVSEYADIIQIGTRNMANYRLLEKVGSLSRPVILKRGFCATIEEFLKCAEYILSKGNKNVILCERGIRTFDCEYTRFTLDLTAVPVLKKETHLPVIVDPSHGTGRNDLVLPMSLAAVAAGADGLLIEVHPSPETAKSDGQQALTFPEFSSLMDKLRTLAPVVGRTLCTKISS